MTVLIKLNWQISNVYQEIIKGSFVDAHNKKSIKLIILLIYSESEMWMYWIIKQIDLSYECHKLENNMCVKKYTTKIALHAKPCYIIWYDEIHQRNI